LNKKGQGEGEAEGEEEAAAEASEGEGEDGEKVPTVEELLVKAAKDNEGADHATFV
jgi:hypothetical protein